MTEPPVVYKVNAPRVVHKTIGGETIIIDLQSGAYYSTDQAGTAIWEQIAGGSAIERVTQALHQRYNGDPKVIENAVTDFVAELEQLSLILCHAVAAPRADSGLDVSPPPAATRPNFQAPVLHRYTDMQDLLLVDPIHEVGTEGFLGAKHADSPADESS